MDIDCGLMINLPMERKINWFWKTFSNRLVKISAVKFCSSIGKIKKAKTGT